MAGERWRTVEGFKTYQVSDRGRVCWKRRKILTQKIDTKGRAYVMFPMGSGRRALRRQIDRLVAEAFLGPMGKGREVRHSDGNVLNNRLGNLFYGPYVRPLPPSPFEGVVEEMQERRGRSGKIVQGRNRYRSKRDLRNPNATRVFPVTVTRREK